MTLNDYERHKSMIEKWASSWGYPIEWQDDDTDYDPPRPVGSIGRFRVIEDDEREGFYAGTEGIITLSVVGGSEYGNERVSLAYTEDDMDEMTGEVTDLDNFEAA